MNNSLVNSSCVKIERRITILCEEHFHIGPQVHKMDRSISKLLEARVKAKGWMK